MKCRRGFSLFETLIYVVVLAVAMGIMLSYFVSLAKRESKLSTQVEIEQAARFAMDKMTATIRSNNKATVPASGNTANSLTLTIPLTQSTVTTTVFAVNGSGTLTMKVDNNAAVPITPPSVKVTSLLFRNLLDPARDLTTSWSWTICGYQQGEFWYDTLVCHWKTKETFCMTADDAFWKHVLPHYFQGDKYGSCYGYTTPKASIRIEMTVEDNNAATAPNEFQSSLTLYGTATIRRQR